ncbi:PGF-CTERM sorting domain-containing protein [Halobellus sp. EA9]|uniref:PGF-CTERM sorting domain-containing protein n=1 Tax=Halobellus sp. EA9 TaxID=3421647 RepID=UPI003EC00CEB
MRTAIVLVTVAALLTAGAAPAFASGLGGPDGASSAVGAADRHPVSSSTEPPTRAETTATPTSTSTSTSTPTPAQNGSNTTDAAGPPPEAKIAAGLLDGGDGRGGSDGRAAPDGLTTSGVVGSTSGTTAADSPGSDGSDGDSIAGTATPSSSTTEATVSMPGTSGGSTPGFGIVVAVAAVLLAAATVTRRR